MLQHLDELRDSLYVLVARKHYLFFFGCVLNIVNEVNHFLAAEFDVVLLEEILHSISNLYAGVLSLFGSHQDSKGCAGNGTTEECA